MTSTVTALNKIPNSASQELVYAGGLANNKFVSLVASHLNSNNPCVNPDVAAADASTLATGSVTASGLTATFPQSIKLEVGSAAATRIYAACYAEGDTNGSGNKADLTWRDSFIRLTVSEIETIVSIGVTHRTTGQISDHPRLPTAWVGSLGAGNYVTLVQADLASTIVGKTSHAFPCVGETHTEASADDKHLNVIAAVSGTKNFYMNTQGLQREDTGTVQSYAVCYSSSTTPATLGSSLWIDAGIRLTVTGMYEVLYASGVSGPTNKDDTMPRHMSSEPLATNRIPLTNTLVLTYSGHTTAASMGNEKWLSLVKVSSSSRAALDPCVHKTVAAKSADGDHSGPEKAATGTKAVTFNTASLDAASTYAVCYATVSGDTSDDSWRDSYIRLKITKLETLTVLGQTIRTVGQLPNTAAQLGKANQPANNAAAGIIFEYSGTLANAKHIALVDASLNNFFPCSGTTYLIGSATTQRSGVHTAGGNKKITTLDTSGLATTLTARQTTNDYRYLASPGAAYSWGDTTLGAFAVCYADGNGAASDAWADSGLRVTVTRLHTLTYKSGFTDPQLTYERYMTSHRAATNRLPRVPNIDWDYHGDLAVAKYVSVVLDTENSNYPCHKPSIAAAGAGAKYSGVMQATGRRVRVLQSSLLGAASNAYFAICYTDGAGSNSDNYWRDSFIRVKTSEVLDYGTKGVAHRTYGQIPHHAAGLLYAYTGALTTNKYISLTHEENGPAYQPSYLANGIHNPCECTSTGCANMIRQSYATSQPTLTTGEAQASGKNVNLHNTKPLDSTKVYAVCYSGDDTTYFDSGVRLTVTKLTGILYSGYKKPVADARNKKTRLIQSVLAPLQPTAEISANVLPARNDLTFVYVGPLAMSKRISLVQVKAGINNNNPCVDPSDAGHAADAEHTGMSRACLSYENQCHGGTNGDKEVKFTTPLTAGQTYTVCYAEGDGGTSDITWRDSYIRVTVSKVTSITTTGVTHTDHGFVADHQSAVKLNVEYAGTLVDNKWLSFVDESLGTGANKYNPCVVGAIAAASADAQHTGAFRAGTSDKVAPMVTNGLSTDVQFAVCYAEGAGNAADTWVDSGIRVKMTKIHTIRYNNVQTPAGPYNSSTSQFLRDHTSSRSYLGGTGYQQINNHEYIHKLPHTWTPTSAALELAYYGTLGNNQHVSLVAVSNNYGDPCATAAIPAAASSTSTGPFRGGQFGYNKVFRVTEARMSALAGPDASGNDPEYTFCYYEGTTVSNADPAYSGLGHVPAGWRDSYVRFKLTKVTTVSSHGVSHTTQGHIANVATLGLSYYGSLAADMWMWLIDETENSNNPCKVDPTTAAAHKHHTIQKARTGTKQVVFDTTGMSTTSNFAVCYKLSSSTVTTRHHDSGIRVTVSAVTQVTYNNEQQGRTTTGQYKRIFNSDNLCIRSGVDTCADAYPRSTNRFNLGANSASFKYIYAGNLVANGAAPGTSIAAGKWISLVDTTQNGGNPCASRVDAAGAATSSGTADNRHRSGAIKAGNTDREVTVAFATGARMIGSRIVAVCYATTSGANTDTTWRDSYIRMVVSKIDSIQSYGIGHRTDGMVASKPSLRILSAGNVAATATVSLVEESVNGYQPCKDKTNAGAARTTANQEIHSGPSTSNGSNKHTLKTDLISSAKTFALCYAEGSGDTSDNTWEDSGLRLQTPKLTSIKYSQPVRQLYAKTCFDSIDLYGKASCRGGNVVGTGASVSQGSDAYRNSQLPRATNVTITYHGPATGALANYKWVSLVEHTLGKQTNNPCRDPDQAAAAAASAGSQDARLHSGPLRAGLNNNQIRIPQTLGVNTGAGANPGLLLDYTKTFAVCYAEGAGDATDDSWRDSYIRVTLSKIKELHASDMVVTTKGAFTNVPSLKVSWVGSLATNQWITIVEVNRNSNMPCDKAFAGAGALRRPYVANQDSTSVNGERSANLQSGSGSKMVDMDTTKLINSNLYAVCYAEGTGASKGSATDSTWMDSGLRLRFVQWKNWENNRFVTGAASKLTFSINYGGFSQGVDQIVLLKGATDCQAAPAAPWLSDGTQVRRHIMSSGEVSLPSGTGVTRVTATDWYTCHSQHGLHLAPESWNSCNQSSWPHGSSSTGQNVQHDNPVSASASAVPDHNLPMYDCLAAAQSVLPQGTTQGRTNLIVGSFPNAPPGCSVNSGVDWAAYYNTYKSGYQRDASFRLVCRQEATGSCNARGQYRDLNLQEGPYAICFCDGEHGNGACDQANEFIKVTGTGIDQNTGNPTGTVPLEPAVKIISAPRLGRMNLAASHLVNIRAVEQTEHWYNIKGSTAHGYSVQDGDKIFFRANDCTAIPSGGVTEAAPITLRDFDTLSASTTFFSARFKLPNNLQADANGKTRTLVACFATKESVTALSQLSKTAHARDYYQLQDGLEVIASPRIGPLGSPGHARAVTGGIPTFTLNTLKLGDFIYFKKKKAGAVTDCSYATHLPNGLIVSPIPSANGPSYTTLLSGQNFAMDGSGKLQLPAGLKGTMLGWGAMAPTVLSVCFVPAGAIVNLFSGNNCPVDTPYVAVGGGTNANGGTCTLFNSNKNASLANVVKLQDDLTMFAEPTDALVNSWFHGHVFELKFTQPQFGVYGTPTFATGTVGDIIVVQKGSCTGVEAISPSTYTIGSTHSAKMVLEEYGGEIQGDEKGGAAQVVAIAKGKVNELPIGIYKICYATAQSEGDDQSDFKELAKTLEILPATATRPSMSTPRSVLRGTDIVVSWESTVNLQTKLQSQNSWIGLYVKGTCNGGNHKHGLEWGNEQNQAYRTQIENTQADPNTIRRLADGAYVETDQHECYLASQFIESGVQSGVVRFSQADYKTAGEFEVRFFQGDSRNVQGRICRGMPGIAHETYVDCVLEPAIVSDKIEVFVDSKNLDHLENIPGIEVMFDDQRARFQKGSRANKMS
jgi:hypothetical protein